MAEDVKKLAEKLVNLSVKEVNELADVLKEEYDIEPATAAAPVAAPAGGGEGGEGGDEEPSTVSVVLKSPGGKKLNVVKKVKQITGLGLKEAKKLVDDAPQPVKEDIDKEEADDLKSQLEEAGAEIEMK